MGDDLTEYSLNRTACLHMAYCKPQLSRPIQHWLAFWVLPGRALVPIPGKQTQMPGSMIGEPC